MKKNSTFSPEVNMSAATCSQASVENISAMMPKLFGPSIEGVNNNTIWAVDLTDPVLVDIFPWEEMLDGDVVALTLSGRDAAGNLVTDKVLQHTLSSIDVGQKLVFEVNKSDISVYGENGHVGETGTLVMFYTVNGVRSPETIFAVHGAEGSDTYTINHIVEVNNSPADGTSFNTVTWTVTNQTGAEVSGLTATASVTGSALINVNGQEAESIQIQLPTSVNYVDSLAESVTATVQLTNTEASASVLLNFSDVPSEGCLNLTGQTPGYKSISSLLTMFNLVKGASYKLSVQAKGNSAGIVSCPNGYYYNDELIFCIQGTPDMHVEILPDPEPGSEIHEAEFTMPLSIDVPTTNAYIIFRDNIVDAPYVSICIQRV